MTSQFSLNTQKLNMATVDLVSCNSMVSSGDLIVVIGNSLELLGYALGFPKENMTETQVIVNLNDDNAPADTNSELNSVYPLWECITKKIAELME